MTLLYSSHDREHNNACNCTEAYVCKFSDNLAFEVGSTIYHHLLGYAEELFFSSAIQIDSQTLLTRLIAEEDEVYHFGVQIPSGRKVEFDIATSYVKTVTVVHPKCNLIEVCITVILGDCAPCMTECVDTVEVILVFHPHILADFLDAVIDVGTETVRITVTEVEVEKILIVLCREILIEYGLDEGLDTHLYIRFIATAVAGLCPLVADDSVMIRLLLHVKEVNCIDTSEAEHQHGYVSAKFLKGRKHLRFGKRAVEELATRFRTDGSLLGRV